MQENNSSTRDAIGNHWSILQQSVYFSGTFYEKDTDWLDLKLRQNLIILCNCSFDYYFKYKYFLTLAWKNHSYPLPSSRRRIQNDSFFYSRIRNKMWKTTTSPQLLSCETGFKNFYIYRMCGNYSHNFYKELNISELRYRSYVACTCNNTYNFICEQMSLFCFRIFTTLFVKKNFKI